MTYLRRFYLKSLNSFFKSAFPYCYRNEKGYIALEIIVVISIMAVIFCGSVIIGRDFLTRTLAELEAARLITTLRSVQEYNRNSGYPRQKEFPKLTPKNATLLKVNVNVDYNYYDIKSSELKRTFEKYNLPKNMRYIKTPKVFSNGIFFLPSGDPYSFGTVEVVAKVAGKGAIRYVIIDRAGRVRLSKNAP